MDMSQWNGVILIKQLNTHATSKHLRFVAVDVGEPYEYRITYTTNTEQVPVGAGSITGHDSDVAIYDANSEEVFSFTVAARFTEKGASNYAAREIVKRLNVLLGK
jgi:hypothetical protein